MKIKKNFYTDKLTQFRSTNATGQDVVDFVSGKDYWRLPNESEINELLQMLNPAPNSLAPLSDDDGICDAKVYVGAICTSKESAYHLWKLCKKSRIRKMVIAGGITAVVVGGVIAYFVVKDRKDDNNNNGSDTDDGYDDITPVVTDDDVDSGENGEEYVI